MGRYSQLVYNPLSWYWNRHQLLAILVRTHLVIFVLMSSLPPDPLQTWLYDTFGALLLSAFVSLTCATVSIHSRNHSYQIYGQQSNFAVCTVSL